MREEEITPVKVLIVDDYPTIRIGIQQIFQHDREIMICGEVGTLEHAVAASSELKPDVILLDIDLPDGSGISAAERICRKSALTKIIMFTEDTSEDSFFRSISAGASGYCLKDAPPGLLRLAILSVFHGATWFDSRLTEKVSKLFSRKFLVTDSAYHLRDTDALPELKELSDREREVLELLAAGLSNHDVAMRLSISIATVKTHVRKILRRLGVEGRTQAALKAVRMRIVKD